MGGLQNHAQQFNQHMAAAGYDVYVFTPRIPGTAPEIENEHPGVHVRRFPAFELIANWPVPQFWRPRFWQLLGQIYRLQGDIIISRTRFFATTWLAALFARFVGRPYVHIEHGADHVQFRSAWLLRVGAFVDHTLGALVLRSATAVVANSKQTAAFVTRLSPKVAPTVIYRGVETKTLAAIVPALRSEYPQNPKVRIGYFGRLIAGKGIEDLITSVADLPREKIEVLIVGDGPDYEYLPKLAESLGISLVVTFIRDTSWKGAMAFLKSCDIIVNPSYSEGLPTVLIEAALCGKAIVATDVGGTSEIVTHGRSGILIPPRNVAALTHALGSLLQQPKQRHELGAHAAVDAAGIFEWPTAVATYQRLFNSLLA